MNLAGTAIVAVLAVAAGCRVGFDAATADAAAPDSSDCWPALFSSTFSTGTLIDFDGQEVAGASSVIGNDVSDPSSPPYNLKATVDGGVANVYKGNFGAYQHLFVRASNVSFSAFAVPSVPMLFGGFQFDVGFVYARFGVIESAGSWRWLLRYAVDSSYDEAVGGVTSPG